ncbi:MAG: metalloregulator ArsR/SmtB family transcription factor [Phycisphaeraceae bacterium]
MIQRVVARLSAMAEETRLRIMLRLRDGECDVSTLAQELDVAQASISRHLAVLKQVGLVSVERHGRHAVCRVADESIYEICAHVCDGVRRHVAREQEAVGLKPRRRQPVKRSGKAGK